MAEAAKSFTSPTEYLALERQARDKHEYRNGEIACMAGSSRQHNRVAANVTVETGQALKSGDCQVFTSDQRVWIPEVNHFAYPDISVTCDSPEFYEQDCLTNPILLIEVLSPSTEGYDRGDKFALYRQIPSLREIVFIGSIRPFVELFRKGQDGRWILEDVTDMAASFTLQSVNLTLAMADVYRKVDLPQKDGIAPASPDNNMDA